MMAILNNNIGWGMKKTQRADIEIGRARPEVPLAPRARFVLQPSEHRAADALALKIRQDAEELQIWPLQPLEPQSDGAGDRGPGIESEPRRARLVGREVGCKLGRRVRVPRPGVDCRERGPQALRLAARKGLECERRARGLMQSQVAALSGKGCHCVSPGRDAWPERACRTCRCRRAGCRSRWVRPRACRPIEARRRSRTRSPWP